VLRLAHEAGPKGRLIVAVHRYVAPLDLASFTHPPSWVPARQRGLTALFPSDAGEASARTRIPTAGVYDVWVGGGFRRPLKLAVDGKIVGQTGYKLLLNGEYTRLVNMKWTRGVHIIDLRYGGGNLHPGAGGDSGGEVLPLGPLILGVGGEDFRVAPVPVKQARKLCGTVLDWVEAVRS
jgi:hypothetical protein